MAGIDTSGYLVERWTIHCPLNPVPIKPSLIFLFDLLESKVSGLIIAAALATADAFIKFLLLIFFDISGTPFQKVFNHYLPNY